MQKNKLLALLLALLVMTLPMGGMAEEAAEPGTLMKTLIPEGYANGREIVAGLGLSVDALPDLAAEQMEAISQIASALKLYVTAAQTDGGAAFYFSLQMQDQTVVDALLCVTESDIELSTSLVPGKTFVTTLEEFEKASSATLNGVNLTSPEMMDLQEMLINDYVTYFYKVANWVSEVQYEHEDLYQYTDDYIDETETRDGVATQMHARVRNDDFRKLIRSLADTFYEDAELQEYIVNAFKEQGATTESVFEAGKAVCLAIAALEPNEGATEFVVSYGDDYETVGFDGTMPAMWKGFPFDVGTLSYSRKTLDESVRHTAQGHMTLPEGKGSVDGTLAVELGNLLDTGRTNKLDLNLLVGNKYDEVASFTIAAQSDAYQEDEIDYLAGNVQANVSLADKAGNSQMAYALQGRGVSGTWVEGEDVYSQSSVNLSVSDLLDVTLNLDLYSQAYVALDVSGYERVNVVGLTDGEMTQLENELQAGVMQAMYQFMSLIPQEALTTLMQAE